MNPTDPRHPWSRLTAAARQMPDSRDDVTAPYGFATRVVALAFAAEPRVKSAFDRFALRAVGIACLLAMASIAINYSSITSSTVTDEHPTVTDDPMAVLLDA